MNENTTGRHEISFTNNIVVKEGSGTASFNLKSGGVTLNHNTLVNVRSAPGNPGGSTADPRFTHRTGALPDGLRLHTASPALGAAEQTVSGLEPDTVCELSGWIRSDGTPTALGAKGYGGSKEHLGAPVTASEVRLRVLGARANPHVAKLGLYKAS
ncbi:MULTISPECIES: hypothetical protein [unclassified Streptomyces]|uniref:hypothetical protein n=1 Tax=unclassified Streptomyces TaxID=2593676 RepID=UPI00324E609E